MVSDATRTNRRPSTQIEARKTAENLRLRKVRTKYKRWQDTDNPTKNAQLGSRT